MKRYYLYSAACLVVFHISLVLVSGWGFNPLDVIWDFENTGQFGDSFGPLTALFSALAAVSAFLAYNSQKEQLIESRAALALDKQDSAKRDFENTFFKMLELLRDVVRDTKIGSRDNSKVGLDAFTYSAGIILGYKNDASEESIKRNFSNIYNNYNNYLAHYFRLCYHILKYIDESNVADKRLYVRIFRANLSNSELIMIGLNAAFGAGRTKFLPLMSQHHLLHNISASDAKAYFLINNLPGAVFGDRAIAREKSSN